MNILVFGTDNAKMNAAGISLRAEDGVAHVHLRNPQRFNPNELETDYDLVILLEKSKDTDVVRGAYDAHNSKEDAKRIDVEDRFDFNPPSSKELAELQGKPHWEGMEIKELIEYASDTYDKKVIGTTKAEIIAAVDRLWVEAHREVETDAEDEPIPTTRSNSMNAETPPRKPGPTPDKKPGPKPR